MRRRLSLFAALVLLPILAALPAAAAQPAPLLITAPVLVSPPSPYAPACSGVEEVGENRVDGVAEPRIAVNPRDPRHLAAVWQQDRWSNGGARGLQAAISRDGGRTWTPAAAPFSRCAGGMPENGGDYERASDPWVTFAPNGDLYQSALGISGRSGRRTSAILVSRSTDGGATWSDAIALREDSEPAAFNDKESITADPHDARFVYAVWDRIDPRARRPTGPTWFSRTTDGGATWEPARPMYTPADGQTIANQIVVLPDGDLLNVFSLYQAVDQPDGPPRLRHAIAAIRSPDRGLTWSEPVEIAEVVAAPIEDPDTGADIRAGAAIVEAAVDARSGAVYLTWNDGRFSGGTHTDIALASSADGGRTWTAPLRVNQTPVPVAAFTPNVAVLADGTVGVSYYDLRSNTPDPATLPAAFWLAACAAACLDPASWAETLIAESFDLDEAPATTGGYFLGDYQGFAASPRSFLLLFVRSAAAPDRPSDVWFATATP